MWILNMNVVQIRKHHYAVAQILFGSSCQFFRTTKGYRTERLSCPANYAENIDCPMHGPQSISHN